MSHSSATYEPGSDEWWDVTDEHGQPTGQTYRRGNPDWPSGRFHLIVATCAYRSDGAVLLTQRSANKEFPLAWEFPGGSALAGESSQNAALRELREETGIQVAADAVTFVERFRESSALLDFYVAPIAMDTELTLCPDEVAAAEWVSLDEVQSRLRAGMMALPWSARLETLWSPLVDTLRQKEFPAANHAASTNKSSTHPRPRIVCICGSVRFWPEMNELIRRLSLDVNIVVAPVNLEGDREQIPEEDRQRLSTLHLRKIDLADSVMVVCPGNYIGESTANEIAYATAAGKQVDYVS